MRVKKRTTRMRVKKRTTRMRVRKSKGMRVRKSKRMRVMSVVAKSFLRPWNPEGT